MRGAVGGVEPGGFAISPDRFEDTENGRLLAIAARSRRMVFFTGLPASGKSFLLRQLILMAVAAGRRVRIMRWDAGLAAFETTDILARYPEVADGTHPVVRRAAGVWARAVIARWRAEHPDPADMLVGEVPIIGNRYSELVEARSDAAEHVLASDETVFIYPIPTQTVREKQEAIRRATFANPQNPDEAKDAPPTTMDQAWRLTFDRAVELGLVAVASVEEPPPYDAIVYRRLFNHLLKHRHVHALDVDALQGGAGSAHDLVGHVTELIATPDEAAAAISTVERSMSAEKAAETVERWHEV